jgi:hypothetical protein
LYCALVRRKISIPGFGEGDALRPVLSPVSDHSAFSSATVVLDLPALPSS